MLQCVPPRTIIFHTVISDDFDYDYFAFEITGDEVGEVVMETAVVDETDSFISSTLGSESPFAESWSAPTGNTVTT